MDASTADNPLTGSRIIAEIQASGIEFVVSVPDITTSEGLLRPLAGGTSPLAGGPAAGGRHQPASRPRLQGGRRRRDLRRPRPLQQARAAAHPADRPARLDQRDPRGRGRVRAADLHDGRPPGEGAGRAAARSPSATACASSSRSSRPWASSITTIEERPRRGEDPARDRRRLRALAAGGAADRTEAGRVMMKRIDCLKALARHVDRSDIVLPVYSSAFDWLRDPAAPAQLPGARRDGARLLARARARAGHARTSGSSCSTATAAC